MKKILLLSSMALVAASSMMAKKPYDNFDKIFLETWNHRPENAFNTGELNYAKNKFDGGDRWWCLFELRYAIRRAAADRVADNFIGETAIPSEEEFYLYNIGQKQFLAPSDLKGAHVALRNTGTTFIAKNINGSNCELQSTYNGYLAEDGEGSPNYHDANHVYVNSGAPLTWTLEPTAQTAENGHVLGNAFLLKNANTGQVLRYHFGIDDNFDKGDEAACHYRDAFDPAKDPDTDALWRIVTLSERKESIKNGVYNAPTDASFVIKYPDFMFHEQGKNDNGNGPWVITNAQWWRNNNDYRRHCMIVSNDDDPTNIHVHQTVAAGVLPSGIYAVECSGLYRDGWWGYTNWENSHVKLYGGNENEPAEGNSVALWNAFSKFASEYYCPDQGRWHEDKGMLFEFPETLEQAEVFFRAGCYRNTVYVKYDNTQPFYIGVKGDGTATSTETQTDRSQALVDNFRLKYYGPESQKIGDMDDADVLRYLKTNELVATGIINVNADRSEADDAIYNLQGIRVTDTSAPGIYIRGGKKFVVR